MRRRILLIGPSLDILGGQSRQLARLLDRFREVPSIEVGFLPVNPRLPGVLRYLQRIKYVRTIVTTVTFWTMLAVRVPRFDILHVFSASYYSYLLSSLPPILMGKAFGKKTLLNYRSGEAEDHLTHWRCTAAPGIRLADMVIVPSEYLVDVFARFEISARPIVNTVDIERFRFRQRDRLRPVFLANRLLEPLYNVSCVLRAFALIQTRYPEARLTIVGDGSERKNLERLAMDLKLRNIQFAGAVPYDQMPTVYDDADIYLTANNVDNMPASIIECFASGLPVIATDAGGVSYILENEETGLLVPLDDHQAMAEAAVRLLEDSDLAGRLIRQAHGSCSQYNWAAARDKWLEVYNELVPDPLTIAANGASTRV